MTGSDGDAPQQSTPGFGERGRMRRRARFLRKARELAYRDLGGLVFDLHRFGARNDEVVRAKLATLSQMDAELRALEGALGRSDSVTVLREVGIAACPRCAAIHGRDDRFCPGCGLAFDANAERPLSTAPVSSPAHNLAQVPTSVPTAPPPASPAATSEIKPATPPARSAPPVLPTAPPIAVPSSSGATPAGKAGLGRPAGEEPNAEEPNSQAAESKTGGEEQPTQILRPPVRGA